MPFAVVSEVTESWFFGSVMCKAGHMARDVSGLVYGATMLAYIVSAKEIYKEFAVYEFQLLFFLLPVVFFRDKILRGFNFLTFATGED